MTDEECRQIANDPEMLQLMDEATLTERYAAQDRAHDATRGLSGDEGTRALFTAFKRELRQILFRRQTTHGVH